MSMAFQRLLLDALRALGLPWLGWQVVAGHKLFRMTVMFTGGGPGCACRKATWW